jgi:hypothetical protein
MVIVVWISAMSAKISAPMQILALSMALISVFGIAFSFFFTQDRRVLWARGTLKFPSFGVLVTLVVPLLYSYLASGGVGSTSFAFRRGPDSFGWGRATYSFCSGDTLTSLVSRVESQLGESSLLGAFQRSPEGVSINSIASFSDQISAEFLIGADRAGIPMLTGAICRLFGTDAALQTVGGLIAWALFLIALISLQIMRSTSSPRFVSSIVAVVSPLSVAILSVTLEGGVGQMVTLPLLLFAIHILYKSDFQISLFLLSLVLLFAGASSTYIDLLYFAVPFFILGVILSGRIREFFSSENAKILAFFVGASLVAALPASSSIFRLLFSFVGTNGAGGWDQGSFYLLSNLFSVSNNSPIGGFVPSERSDSMWIIESVLSLLIVIALILLGRKATPFLIVISGYLILTYLVYMMGATNINNYRIWKYSMYATSFMPLLFSFLFSRSPGFSYTKASTRNWKARFDSSNGQIRGFAKHKFLSALGYVLLLSTALSSYNWVVDWDSSKTLSVSKNAILELNSLVPLYDIQVLSRHHLEPVQLAAVSTDLRFGTSDRWGVVFRSEPHRPFAYLIRLTETCDRECALEVWPGLTQDNSLQEIENLKYFVVFKETLSR